MLGLRLAEGLPRGILDAPGKAAADRAITDGLLTATPGGRLVLTRRGRLLTDTVVRNLLVGSPTAGALPAPKRRLETPS
jgi:oxygen-independent coproporphyrinogen-3 oxidase